jgi:hypothetical protein
MLTIKTDNSTGSCPNQIICRNTVSFVLPLRALYPLTAQPHSMGELIPPESGTQTAPIALWDVHPSAGYPWRYDMGGHQTVLDVALTYGFIANRGEQQSFSGSDVYEEIGLGNKPSRPQHYQHCTSITMHFFIDISMVYNIIEMIND